MARLHVLPSALFASAIVLGLALSLQPARAIDAAIAKQCNGMLAKAFPPRVPGNPAAGSAKGNSKQQRDYFKTCVANNGKMDDDAAAKK